MIYLQRKLRACYDGEEKFRPEVMPAKKYLPVIGFSTKRILKSNGEKQEYVDQPYLIIIGNNGRPIEVVMFNLKVMIDERSEVNMDQISNIVQNLTIMGKALCEKLTGIHFDSSIEPEKEKDQKGETGSPDKPV